jgi:hypothetical protein
LAPEQLRDPIGVATRLNPDVQHDGPRRLREALLEHRLGGHPEIASRKPRVRCMQVLLDHIERQEGCVELAGKRAPKGCLAGARDPGDNDQLSRVDSLGIHDRILAHAGLPRDEQDECACAPARVLTCNFAG